MVYGSWLKAHGSCFKARGSRLMTKKILTRAPYQNTSGPWFSSFLESRDDPDFWPPEPFVYSMVLPSQLYDFFTKFQNDHLSLIFRSPSLKQIHGVSIVVTSMILSFTQTQHILDKTPPRIACGSLYQAEHHFLQIPKDTLHLCWHLLRKGMGRLRRLVACCGDSDFTK